MPNVVEKVMKRDFVHIFEDETSYNFRLGFSYIYQGNLYFNPKTS